MALATNCNVVDGLETDKSASKKIKVSGAEEVLSRGVEAGMQERVFSKGDAYSGFKLRGEGLSNVVVATTRLPDHQNVVWRFRKARKTRLLLEDSDALNAHRYIRTVIAPLLGRKYLSVPSVISLDSSDVGFLSGIPHLADYFPWNMRVQKDGHLLALEMPDFTSLSGIPGPGPTITVEIKPKQGFKPQFQPISHSIPQYCTNCLTQFAKWQNGQFARLYDFCSLDLFSGNFDKMDRAIRSLIANPHHNLRIFHNGEPTHTEEAPISEPLLESLIFPDSRGTIDTFVEVINRILSGSTETSEPFGLYKESVLHRLLEIQKLDTIGIWTAYEIYNSLPESLALELKNPYFFFENSKKLMTPSDTGPLKLLKGYLIAATIRDCSLLLSMKQVSPEFAADYLSRISQKTKVENMEVASGSGKATPQRCGTSSDYAILNMTHTNPDLYFAYKLSVVDLDAKSAKKIQSNRQRLLDAMSGLEHYASKYSPLQRPCVISYEMKKANNK